MQHILSFLRRMPVPRFHSKGIARNLIGASPSPDELIEIPARWKRLEVSSLFRGNDGDRFGCEGYSALLRAGQISPGQSAAATAAKRRPGFAELMMSALLRAVQSQLIPFVSPLTGLTISTYADPGRRYAATAASLCPGLTCDGLSGQRTIQFREAESTDQRRCTLVSYGSRRNLRSVLRMEQDE